MAEIEHLVVVVPRGTGDWELRSHGHEVTVATAASDDDDLPPFDFPDVASLRRAWERSATRTARLRIDGGRLDLADHEDLLAAAHQHGARIEFHVF